MSKETASPLKFVQSEALSRDSQQRRADLGWFAQSEVLEKFLDSPDSFEALSIWLEYKEALKPADWSVEKLRSLLLRAICEIDELINKQVNAIIHHKRFQELEASWRGIHYLCQQDKSNDPKQQLKLKVISLSWHELSRDVSRAIEFDQSELFRLIYTDEYSMPGGEPYGLIIGDYRVSHKARPGHRNNDMSVLRAISHAAAAAFSPFVTAAEPSLFGVDYFSELASVSNIGAQFELPEYVQWRTLRDQDDSRFLAITVPSVLMREPYKNDGSRDEHFSFDEVIHDAQQDYLWGNAAYGVAAVALRGFLESGWFTEIRGMQPGKLNHGLLSGLPSSKFNYSRKAAVAKPSVNLQVGDRLEKQMADNGFIPASVVPQTEHLAFYSNATVNLPKSYNKQAVNVNARLSSMLQYILCVSRFAHYIKVMGRDKVGSYETASSVEQDFQRWLHQYTTASDEGTDEIRAKRPLNEARIQVKEQVGRSGHYYSIIHLRPHFQLDQMVSSIRLITELSPRLKAAG